MALLINYFVFNLDLAASGIDYSIKLIEPTPLPIDEDEHAQEEDDFEVRAIRRRTLAELVST